LSLRDGIELSHFPDEPSHSTKQPEHRDSASI
jgi:hypothetical protein